MKQIRHWFQQLPEPCRSEALANTSADHQEFKTDSLERAIGAGFAWTTSPQRYDYWAKIHSKAKNGEFDQSL